MLANGSQIVWTIATVVGHHIVFNGQVDGVVLRPLNDGFVGVRADFLKFLHMAFLEVGQAALQYFLVNDLFELV